MAIGKEIKVVLTLDDKGFKVGIRDANGELKHFGQRIDNTAKSVKNIEHSMTSFGAKAHRMIMTLGMARFALMDIHDIFLRFPLAIMKSAGEIERMTKLMEGLSTQTDAAKKKLEAAANVKFLFNMALNAPFEVKALGDAFVKLKTGGIDPTNGSLQALVDGVAKFGGSSEQLKRAAIAIQQMGGKGVVSMEELRQQLGEAVPTAMRAMADGMGLTMAELTSKVAKGTVEAKSALSKMLIVMSLTNANAAAGMMDTWVGMLEQLKTKWELFKLQISGEGMFDNSKAALKELLAAFGSDSAGSLARSIGKALDGAVVSVIGFTKQVVHMWDTIVEVGKAVGIYWAVSKFSGPLSSVGDAIAKTTMAIRASGEAVKQEAADRKKAFEEKAAAMRNQIAANDAAIVAERNRTVVEKAADAERVASAIKANQAEILAAREKAAALLAIEQEIRMRSMAIALESERVLRSKKAGSGADARRMAMDAAGLAQNADILKKEREMLLSNAAAMDTRNKSMQKMSELALISNNVTNSTITTLNQKTNALRQVVVQHEALARSVTASSAAMNAMNAAATSVVGFLKSMVFSMNGLVIAITATFYVWDMFRQKAQEAARDAKIAMDLRDRLKRDVANEDDVNGQSRTNDRMKQRLREVDQELALLRNSGDKVRIDKLKNERLLLDREIEEGYKKVQEAKEQTVRRNALGAGADLTVVAQNEIAKATATLENQRQALQQKFDNLGKPSADDEKQYKTAQEKNLQEQLTVKKAAIDALSQKYKDALNVGTIAQKDKIAYEKVLENLAQMRSQVTEQSISLKAPNKFMGSKKDETKGSDPTDALLTRLRAERASYLDAKQFAASIRTDVTEIGFLRQQAEEEVRQIIENDRTKAKKHTDADKQELIDLITNRKVVDEAIRELRAVRGKIPALKADVELFEELARNGDVSKQSNKSEHALVKMLKQIEGSSVEARLALQQLKPEIDEATNLAVRKDIATATIENEKRLKDLRLDTIVDTRQRIIEEGKIEIAAVSKKYDELLAKAQMFSEQHQQLERQKSEELTLAAQRQAIAMETPLQKQARDWQNGFEQMEQATTQWSQGFLDTLSSALSGGTANWRTFLAGMLKSILDMQLKAQLGQQINGVAGKVGNWLKNTMGMTGPGAAPGAPAEGAASGVGGAVAGGVANSALNAATKATTEALKGLSAGAQGTQGQLETVSNQGLGGFLVAIWQSIFGKTAEMTVEQAAMAAIAQMAFNAYGASVALTALTSAAIQASAAQTAGSFFANGGIMSSSGSLPLRKYANGGIANRPQLAVFGEGRMNEAYVPLPDGRTIPVTMQGGGGDSGTNVMINITVHEDGGETSDTSSGGNEWRAMADKIKAVVREELNTAQRPGGQLYK